jgi:hypothetical protein
LHRNTLSGIILGMASQPLFDEPFLRAQWNAEFDKFQGSPEAAALLARLRAWSDREQLTERSSETALNAIIYLYRLTPEEIATVEAG